jgi:hypothetical protein
MQLADTDLAWVEFRFPTLSHRALTDGGHEFTGTLFMDGSFEPATRIYTFVSGEHSGANVLHDSYRVRIYLPKKGLPKIYETGSRILPYAEYHKFSDHSICAWGSLDPPEEDASIQEVFSIILEYFFDQTHHVRYEIWPRGEFHHAEEGILHNYEQLILDSIDKGRDCVSRLMETRKGRWYVRCAASQTQIKGHHPCLCGSKDHFRRCHGEIFRGLWNLQKYCWQNNIGQSYASDLSVYAAPSLFHLITHDRSPLSIKGPEFRFPNQYRLVTS